MLINCIVLLFIFITILQMLTIYRNSQNQCIETCFYIYPNFELPSYLSILVHSLSALKIKQGATIKNSAIIFPKHIDCTHANIHLLKNLSTYNHKTFIGIPLDPYLANRSKLWSLLTQKYPLAIAKSIMPQSFVMPQEYNLLQHHIQTYPNDTFVYKANTHRQEAIYVTQNCPPIHMIKNEQFVIAQQYIPNTLIYKGHKITIRVYLIILASTAKTRAFLFNDGLVYYSYKTYDTVNANENRTVASFYEATELYDKGFPITIKKLLYNFESQTKPMWEKIVFKIRLILTAFNEKLTSTQFGAGNLTFQYFGVDILLTDTFDPYILEINIGPGMQPHNNEDSLMRANFANAAMKLLIGQNCAELQHIM